MMVLSEDNAGVRGDLPLQLSCKRGKAIFQPEFLNIPKKKKKIKSFYSYEMQR